jgi:ferredoxin
MSISRCWSSSLSSPAIHCEQLNLLTMPSEVAEAQRTRLSTAYREAQPDPDLCTGCEQCLDVCWYDALLMQDGLTMKSAACVR